MTISFLELNHAVSGGTTFKPVGMRLTAELIDTAIPDPLPNVDLKVTVAVIIKRTGSSYYNFIIPVNVEILDLVSAIITTANIKYKILLIDKEGAVALVQEEVLTISDYRVDEGVVSKTITITSTRNVVDAMGTTFVITPYTNKIIRDNNDGSHTIDYTISELDYRYIGVGKDVIDGNITSSVTSKSLNINATTANFTVQGITYDI